MNKDQLDWLVLHQANQRILDAAARKLDVEPSKVGCKGLLVRASLAKLAVGYIASRKTCRHEELSFRLQ